VLISLIFGIRTITIYRPYQQGEEKDSNSENDRQNVLRMSNQMTMKEKRFSLFFRRMGKWYADTYRTHLQIAQADTQTKICKRVQFYYANYFVFASN